MNALRSDVVASQIDASQARVECQCAREDARARRTQALCRAFAEISSPQDKASGLAGHVSRWSRADNHKIATAARIAFGCIVRCTDTCLWVVARDALEEIVGQHGGLKLFAQSSSLPEMRIVARAYHASSRWREERRSAGERVWTAEAWRLGLGGSCGSCEWAASASSAAMVQGCSCGSAGRKNCRPLKNLMAAPSAVQCGGSSAAKQGNGPGHTRLEAGRGPDEKKAQSRFQLRRLRFECARGRRSDVASPSHHLRSAVKNHTTRRGVLKCETAPTFGLYLWRPREDSDPLQAAAAAQAPAA